MDQEEEIMELSHLNNDQILIHLRKLLENNQYSRFTLFVKKKQKLKSDRKLNSLGFLNLLPTTIQQANQSFCQLQTFKILKQITNKPYKELQKEKEDVLLHQHQNINIKEKIEIEIKQTLQKEQNQLKEVLNLSTNNEQVQMMKALRYYNNNEYKKAIESLICQQVVLLNKREKKQINNKQFQKSYSVICFHLGNCYYRLKDYDKAIKYYQMELEGEIQSQKGQRFNNLATCYAIKNQTQLSLKFYTEALKIYTKYPEFECSNLLNNLGIIYFKSGMFDTAAQYFLDSINVRKAKSSDNEDMIYYSYFKMGLCQKLSKKYQESINSFLFALNFAEKGIGNYGNVLKELGLVYELLQKWEESLTCYQKLSEFYIGKNIGQGYIYERVGFLQQKLGNHNQFQRLLKIACQEYKNQGNMRKASELTNYCKK